MRDWVFAADEVTGGVVEVEGDEEDGVAVGEDDAFGGDGKEDAQ